MTSESKSPLESAGEILGNLQEQAEAVLGDLATTAENMADSVLGEETVDKVKEVLNTDVGELAQDLLEKVQGQDQPKG